MTEAPRRVLEAALIVRLPKGDWKFTTYRGAIICVSPQHPAMIADHNGLRVLSAV